MRLAPPPLVPSQFSRPQFHAALFRRAFLLHLSLSLEALLLAFPLRLVIVRESWWEKP